MSNKPFKRLSTPLATRERPNKNLSSYDLSQVKKSAIIKCRWRGRGTGNFLILIMSAPNSRATLENWHFLTKLNTLLPCDSAISFVGIYSRERKTNVHKNICTRLFLAFLFLIVPNWEQPEIHQPGNRWSVCNHMMELGSAIKWINCWFMQQHGWITKTRCSKKLDTNGNVLYDLIYRNVKNRQN